MKVFDLVDQQGRVFAFEVENLGLGRRGLCRVVQSIPGVQLLSTPRSFSWFREEVFCQFSLGGATFEAWEPFGDNSRYWVGPKPVVYSPEIKTIRAAFVAHTLFFDRPVLSFFKKSRAV